MNGTAITNRLQNSFKIKNNNLYRSSYYWNFRTSSFKQVVCLILSINARIYIVGKFPPLINARASSTNCTMGNLAPQHTYIQYMLYLPRFISFLLYKSLINGIFFFTYIWICKIFILFKFKKNISYHFSQFLRCLFIANNS